MVQDVDLYIWMNLAAVVLFSFTAAVAWQHRDKPAGFPLVVFSGAGACWAIVPELLFFALGRSWVYWGTILGYVFIDLTVVAWLYIALEYSSRESNWVPSMLPMLVAVPAINQTVQWTNSLHGLFYADLASVEPAVLYYVHVALAFATITTGIALVVDEYRRARGVYRRQAAAMVTAMGLYMLAALMYVFDGVPGPSNSLSLGGPFVAGVFLWALFYADFLEVVPVARETLVENMTDAVIALDTEGRVIDVNAAARERFGVDAGVVGRPFEAVFADHPPLLELLDGGLGSTTVTVERDGETCHYDLTVSPVYDDARDVLARLAGRRHEHVGDLVVVRDVTERKRRERELERTNRRLDQFAGFVSHDLRTPLGIASSYLDFAEETGNEADFEAVRKRLERMDAMLGDLLRLARLDAKSVEPEPCQLAEVARSAWEHVDVDEASLTLRADETLSADRTHLYHVFENLFRNSVEHGSTSHRTYVYEEGATGPDSQARQAAAERDEPTVTIEVGVLEDEPGFYVADDGPGIPDGMEETIFQQGYSTKVDGTGLGLAIVQTIVEAHGWSLRVTDSENGGARFEISTGTTTGA